MNERITVDPGKMGGVPCIRGLRVPVATILNLVVSNVPYNEILEDYPDLVEEDIEAALLVSKE